MKTIENVSKQRRFGSIFLLVMLFIVHTVTASDEDLELWNRATQIFKNNLEWSPGKMVLISDNLDRKGEIKAREERTVGYYKNSSGEIESQIISVTKNGEDITEEEREKEQKESKENENSPPFPNPLDPETRDITNIDYTGRLESIDGRRCQVINFRMKAEEKRDYVGEIWITEDQGVPILITGWMEPLPRFVTELIMRVEYTADPSAWYMKSIFFEGSGKFLFLRRHYRSTMRFSEYFRTGN